MTRRAVTGRGRWEARELIAGLGGTWAGLAAGPVVCYEIPETATGPGDIREAVSESSAAVAAPLWLRESDLEVAVPPATQDAPGQIPRPGRLMSTRKVVSDAGPGVAPGDGVSKEAQGDGST